MNRKEIRAFLNSLTWREVLPLALSLLGAITIIEVSRNDTNTVQNPTTASSELGESGMEATSTPEGVPQDLHTQTGLVARIGSPERYLCLYHELDENNHMIVRFGRHLEGATAYRFVITDPNGYQWTEGEFAGWTRVSEPPSAWESLKPHKDPFQEIPGVYEIDTIGRGDPGWDEENASDPDTASRTPNDVHLPVHIQTDGRGGWIYRLDLTVQMALELGIPLEVNFSLESCVY